MHRPQRESFVIQVRGSTETLYQDQTPQASSVSPKLNFSAMKLFNRFRKILMRLIFSLPSGGSSGTSSMATKQKNCDKFDPPKTSCSSYYSSHSHYTEAIADCIEFFNKSAQEGILEGLLRLPTAGGSKQQLRSSITLRTPTFNGLTGGYLKQVNERVYVHEDKENGTMCC